MRKQFIWGSLIVFIVAEFLLFRNYILREIIPFYPRSFDQTWYLTESYRLYEKIIAKGFLFSALASQTPFPQTLLFPGQAAIFYLFFGASRLSALTLNFIYFASLQAFSFVVIKKITGRYWYSFLFLLLSLSLQSLSFANDFRIDFMSFCLYGIFCAVVMRSDVFLSKPWSVGCFAAAVWLILMRYITGCYVLALGLLTLSYFMSVEFIKKPQYLFRNPRIKHLLYFNVGIVLLLVLLFWKNYHVIHDYYIVGHATGAEKTLRLKEALLATGLSFAWLYYPTVFFKYHFPFKLLVSVLGILLIAYGTYLFTKQHKPHTKKKLPQLKPILIFLGFSIFTPLAILTMDESKSPIVIGIIAVPVTYFLLLCFYTLIEKIKLYAEKPAQYVLIMATIIIILLLPHHVLRMFSITSDHYHFYKNRDREITAMINTIGDYADSLRWEVFSMASEKSGDYVIAPIVPIYYEAHQQLFQINGQKLGNTFFGITHQEALDSVRHAEIFVLDLNNIKPDKVYPFESSILPYHHELEQMANQNMVILGDFYIDKNKLRVYARPDASFSVPNMLNNLIDSEGLWVNIPGVVAAQTNALLLIGKSDFSWLGGKPLQVYVTAFMQNHDVPLKANLTIHGNQYKILLALPTWQSNAELSVHLTFSASHKQGEEDIVMPLPTQKIFFLKPKSNVSVRQ